jgi:CBS domain-containing protein
MRAEKVMTQPVVSVGPDTPVLEAIRIMLQKKISGLPVVEQGGRLVGMITEGDLLRRVETGTYRRRPRWIEFLIGPGRLAEEYVHAAGRKVAEVMTSEVHAAEEGTPLDEIVDLMERYRIKRVPIVRDGALVGIVTRANLLRAVIHSALQEIPTSPTDATIRERLRYELSKQPWAPVNGIDVEVRNGVVTLSGVISDDRQRSAFCVAAENIPGVKRVEDRLAWIIPGTALLAEPPLAIEAAPH